MECAQHFTERELAHCHTVARLQELGRGVSRGGTPYQQPWEGTVKSLHDTLIRLADERRGGSTEDPRQKVLGWEQGYWSFEDQAWVVRSGGTVRRITPAFREEEWELFRPRTKWTASGGRKRPAATARSSPAKRQRRVEESSSSSSSSSGSGSSRGGSGGGAAEGEVVVIPVEMSDDEVEPGTPEEQRVRHDAQYRGPHHEGLGLTVRER